MSDIKICSNCKVEKELTEFNKYQKNKDGYNNKCKICINIISKNWYINNKDRKQLNAKKWRLKNEEKLKEYRKEYYILNKEKLKEHLKEYNKEYYNNNQKKIREYSLHYYYNNIEKSKQNNKQWVLNNKEYRYKYNNEYVKNRKKTDSLFKLISNIRISIRTSIKRQGFNKKSKTYEILGCTFEEFKQHIERQFTKNMTWENRNEWHLDHIYPVSLAKNEEEIIKLNHYTNFQPLWAKDNLQKSNKIIDNKQLKLI